MFPCFFHVDVQLHWTPNSESSGQSSTIPILVYALNHVVIEKRKTQEQTFHFHVHWTWSTHDALNHVMIQINESSWAEYHFICIEPSVLILGMHVIFKRTPQIMDYHATCWVNLFCDHHSIFIWMDLFTFNLHSGGGGWRLRWIVVNVF